MPLTGFLLLVTHIRTQYEGTNTYPPCAQLHRYDGKTVNTEIAVERDDAPVVKASEDIDLVHGERLLLAGLAVMCMSCENKFQGHWSTSQDGFETRPESSFAESLGLEIVNVIVFGVHYSLNGSVSNKGSLVMTSSQPS